MENNLKLENGNNNEYFGNSKALQYSYLSASQS